jgi:hypothetical protein
MPKYPANIKIVEIASNMPNIPKYEKKISLIINVKD